MIEAYVATSFANPELAFVYYAERVNLAPADEVLLRNVQKSTIDSWVSVIDVGAANAYQRRKPGSGCTRRWRSSSTSDGWFSTTVPRTRRHACGG